MAPYEQDIATFYSPALCANNKNKVDGVVVACNKNANNACGGCNLVQVIVVCPFLALYRRHNTHPFQHLPTATARFCVYPPPTDKALVLLQRMPDHRLEEPQVIMPIRTHERYVEA
jgi:hypothetical protein